ncbi:MAG TPA: hypothetical protein DDW50_16785 [Firmicutes bacterium]|jgi:hypothetical protein|nr:hypothetical protein [Bacillota bacterium]
MITNRRKLKGGLTDIIKKLQDFFAYFYKSPNNQNAPPPESGGWNRSFVKNLFWFCLLFIVAFLAVRLTGHAGRLYTRSGDLVPNVHYVDSAGRNFLFRGGLPLINNQQTFNYKGLKQAITIAGNEAGVQMPKDFFIVDVNLLNIESTNDRNRIFVEHQFFKNHPTLGFIQVWGINGTGLHVTDPILAANRDYLGRHLDKWLKDGLGSRIETLRKWLIGAKYDQRMIANLPIVFFVHCVAGCDRTGEFIGAYYLRYMNKSWQEMNELNQRMCPHERPFNCRNYYADQWYCLWLNQARGFTLNWWQEFPCSGKHE